MLLVGSGFWATKQPCKRPAAGCCCSACRKIARALREAHAKDPGLRHVTRGAKKTCSYCGSEGHTRRGCAKLKADTAAQQAADGEVAAAEGSQRRRRGPQLITEERKK